MSAGDSDARARARAASRAGGNVRQARGRALTHASVTELELRFAQNPRSDAYIALCEAYLMQGRFMEAMVVSKKGIKAHPDAVEAKLLLSRVYAAQGKYPRAQQTLAAAMAAHPDDARVYALRARVKISSGDQTGAVQDLRRALELDPANQDALTQLDALGVTQPQTTDLSTGDVASSTDVSSNAWTGDLETTKVPALAPTPMTADLIAPSELPSGAFQSDVTVTDFQSGDLSADLLSSDLPSRVPDPRFTTPDPGFAFGGTPGENLAFDDPTAEGEVPSGTGLAFSNAPRNEFDFAGTFGHDVAASESTSAADPKGRGMSFVGPDGSPRKGPIATLPPIKVAPQRLEGEDELEKLARQVAEQKVSKGRPRTTLILLLTMLLVGGAIVGQRFFNKYKVEQIEALMAKAQPAFAQDTYGGYKQAAQYLENILENLDPTHPLTLGRLAHTYAILWTEHGESVKDRLNEVLVEARANAPDVSHTVAAIGLTELNTGKDRRTSAQQAYKSVSPLVEKTKADKGPPTYADLTLGIIELDLGEYDGAEKRLARVREFIPGARSLVWHGRAAYRARRLGAALSSFRAASRAEPSHAGALAGQVLTYLDRGDLPRADEALKQFDELQRTNPKQVSYRDAALALYARSALLRADGQDGKANGVYEEAVRADPRNADFPFGLGRWLLQNDRAQEALVPLEQAVAMESSRWVFHIEIAEAEMMVGQWEQAKVNIDEALALAPDKAEVALAKARWMRRRRQPDTESYLHSLFRKHPSAKLGINLELGRLYRAQRKFRRAERALEAALEDLDRYPKVVQADVLISYGRLMLDRRKGETALNSFREAAKRGAAEGYYRIAYAQYGGNAQAKAEAKRACDKLMAAGSSSGYAVKAKQLCQTL